MGSSVNSAHLLWTSKIKIPFLSSWISVSIKDHLYILIPSEFVWKLAHIVGRYLYIKTFIEWKRSRIPTTTCILFCSLSNTSIIAKYRIQFIQHRISRVQLSTLHCLWLPSLNGFKIPHQFSNKTKNNQDQRIQRIF